MHLTDGGQPPRTAAARPWAVAAARGAALGAATVLLSCSPLPRGTSPAPQAVAQPRVQQAFGKVPLHFEANRGQADLKVKYLSRGPGYTVYLTPEETVFALLRPVRTTDERAESLPGGRTDSHHHAAPATFSVLRTRLLGANPQPEMTALDELPGKANYFVGNDPSRWRTNVSLHGKVRAKEVYPGIDLVYYGNPQQLEYDFIVAPDADPGRIRLAFAGQTGPLRLDEQGNLIVPLEGGDVVQQKPVAYQEVDGARVPVPAQYALLAVAGPSGSEAVAIAPGAFDPALPLVIDPVLVYSTFLGGLSDDRAGGIAVDAVGNAYVTGVTSSANFPTTAGAFQTGLHIGGYYNRDVFVTKISPDGTTLLYSTFLGGFGDDGGWGFAKGIAVDGAGNAFVTGETSSTDFPTVAGGAQTTYGGGFEDAFVAKLSPSGSALVYSTYLGGSDFDSATGIAIDGAGSAYVGGTTGSTDFPTVNPFQPTHGGGMNDAFVTKLTPDGTGFAYSTYLGASSIDIAQGIAVNAGGWAFVVGDTHSPDFPVQGALQLCPPLNPWTGTADVFVTKLNTAGNGLVYSTCLGGESDEFTPSVAVDGTGSAYVTGYTTSRDFPLTDDVFFSPGADPDDSGRSDVFVSKLTPSGDALAYSTYLGGSGQDRGTGIAVDSAGGAYVVGMTESPDFPTAGAPKTARSGLSYDAFVFRLSPSGKALIYSGYLGGSNDDQASGVALGHEPIPAVYVAGLTLADFPTTGGVFQPTKPGSVDGFVAKIGPTWRKSAQQSIGAGGTVTTDVETDGATPTDPMEVFVTTPNAGTVTIVGAVTSTDPYWFEYEIAAPTATESNPLIIKFRLDATVVPAFLLVLRDSALVPDSCFAAGIANPSPCTESITTLPDGDLLITVNSYAASLWEIRGCGAAGCPDVLVDRVRPIKATIRSGNTEAVKKVSVTVRNVAPVAVGAPTEAFQLAVDDRACPGVVTGGPDFDGGTEGAQSTVTLARGEAKKAKVVLTVARDAFTTFNAKATARCRLVFTARVVAGEGDDPTPANNVLAVDLNVKDKNDPEQSVTHESNLDSIAPIQLTIGDGVPTASTIVHAKVGNADYLPLRETPGHAVALAATADADPNCAGLTVAAVDCDSALTGSQSTVTVKGGAKKKCDVTVSAVANQLGTPNPNAPQRCRLMVEASGPSPETAPLDPSNNSTTLVVDVLDQNDF